MAFSTTRISALVKIASDGLFAPVQSIFSALSCRDLLVEDTGELAPFPLFQLQNLALLHHASARIFRVRCDNRSLPFAEEGTYQLCREFLINERLSRHISIHQSSFARHLMAQLYAGQEEILTSYSSSTDWMSINLPLIPILWLDSKGPQPQGTLRKNRRTNTHTSHS